MSEITLKYEHLENAELVRRTVHENYHKFDWGTSGNWDKNCKALMDVIGDLEESGEMIGITMWKIETSQAEIIYSLVYYEPRLNSFVQLDKDVSTECEFMCEYDVIEFLNDYVGNMKDAREHYKIDSD